MEQPTLPVARSSKVSRNFESLNGRSPNAWKRLKPNPQPGEFEVAFGLALVLEEAGEQIWKIEATPQLSKEPPSLVRVTAHRVVTPMTPGKRSPIS